MKIAAAFTALLHGHRIRRREWQPDVFVMLVGHKKPRIRQRSERYCLQFQASLRDIEADDWEIVK